MSEKPAYPSYLDVLPVAAAGIVVAFLASLGKPDENWIYFGMLILLSGVFSWSAVKCLIVELVRPDFDRVFVVIGAGMVALAICLNVIFASATRFSSFSPGVSGFSVTLVIILDVCAIAFILVLPRFARYAFSLEVSTEEKQAEVINLLEQLEKLRPLYIQLARRSGHAIPTSEYTTLDSLIRVVRSISPSSRSERCRQSDAKLRNLMSELETLIRGSDSSEAAWHQTQIEAESIREKIEETIRARELSLIHH